MKTIEQNTKVFTDEIVLIKFLMAYPDDKKYGANNQRFWTEYHSKFGAYQLHEQFHIVKPSANESTYTKIKSLVPYKEWSYIGQTDIFIHGPFNFKTINGQKN